LARESKESVVAESLEDKLFNIERGGEELRQAFVQLMQKDSAIYVSDLIIFGALKRTLSLSDGFRRHIREHNFTCAAALLRLQLDTALRLFAASLHKNPEEYAKAVFEGKRVDKLKDRRGNRLTDSYLAERLSEQYPWVKKVYVNLCDFIHLSNRHFFSSIAQLDDSDRTFKFQISAKDVPRPDSDYFEIVDGFYETTRLTFGCAVGWHRAIHSSAAAA
jgi:hypothetical protein